MNKFILLSALALIGCGEPDGKRYRDANEIFAERCLLRWKDSGRQARYLAQVGCQVQNKEGYWFPEKNVKENL